MLEPKDLRILALLLAVSGLGGVVRVLVHPELDLLAPLPDPGACTVDPGAAGADGLDLVERIDPDSVATMLERGEVFVVDARPPEAFQRGHVPGAMNLPAAEAAVILEMESVGVGPGQKIVTYCDGTTNGSSDELGRLLRDKAGCDDVQVLDGGWPAWVDGGHPVEARNG